MIVTVEIIDILFSKHTERLFYAKGRIVTCEEKALINKECTFRLNTHFIEIGDTIFGSFDTKDSGTYGKIFKQTRSIRVMSEEDLANLLLFLKNKGIKGEQQTLQRIIQVYGLRFLKGEVFTHKELGMSKKNYYELVNILKAEHKLIELLVFLLDEGISITFGLELYQTLGESALTLLKENPQTLYENESIPFAYSDYFAKEVVNDARCGERIAGAIIHYLQSRVNLDGTMAIPKNEIQKIKTFIEQEGSYLAIENQAIDDLQISQKLNELIDRERIISYAGESGTEFLFSFSTNELEKKVAQNIATRIERSKPILKEEELNEAFCEHENSIENLTREQKEAVGMAVTNPFSVLTGGPGTGKTYVVNSIVRFLKTIKPHLKISLLGPTGKAANASVK